MLRLLTWHDSNEVQEPQPRVSYDLFTSFTGEAVLCVEGEKRHV
jgi:hypothetical protein